MIYEILFGKHPWAAEKYAAEKSPVAYLFFKNVMKNPLEFPENNNVDPLMIDLIGRMLKKLESERISWADIAEHKILQRNDIPDFLDI